MGSTNSYIKNSNHFIEKMSIKLDEKDLLVSFDIQSLFTKVPIDEALSRLAIQLECDDTLEEHTSMSHQPSAT